jgi:predicted RNA binding protein YcfA (HicA-like mRNA interferase family)
VAKRIEAGELVEMRATRLCRVVQMEGVTYSTRRGSSYPMRRLESGQKVLVTGREKNEAWGLMVRFIRLEDGIEYQVEPRWVRRVKEQ